MEKETVMPTENSPVDTTTPATGAKRNKWTRIGLFLVLFGILSFVAMFIESELGDSTSIFPDIALAVIVFGSVIRFCLSVTRRPFGFGAFVGTVWWLTLGAFGYLMTLM